MKRPKISLITISYNSAETIEDTIQSVLAQTYKNYEYIIIDGASTDSTMEIIDKYRDGIARVISEPDRGISDAFNKGIRVATGDIIGICNSNDLLYPDAFQTIVDAYEEGIDAYRAPVTTKNFDTGFEYVVRPTLYIPKIPFMASKCHMGCYITKDAYCKYGLYDEKFKYSMDLELLRRFTYNGAKMKEVAKPIGIFRLGGVSQTQESKKAWEREQVILRYGGNQFDVLMFKTLLYVKAFAKRFLNCLGENNSAKLREKIR